MTRKPHFSLLGVPVSIQPAAGLPGLLVGALTYALLRGLARASGQPDRAALPLALASALLWYETDLAHVGGHIISSRLADAPMDYVRWGIIPVNGYRDHGVSPRQHIGRSLGGVIASALVALLYGLAWRALGTSLLGRLALIAFVQNTLITLASLLPTPLVDGGVILQNLRRL